MKIVTNVLAWLLPASPIGLKSVAVAMLLLFAFLLVADSVSGAGCGGRGRRGIFRGRQPVRSFFQNHRLRDGCR